MKKIITIIVVLLGCLNVDAQTATVQPKIMVIPYVVEGVDLRKAIEADPNIRIVLSKIREAFDNRGFNTVDFETKLKAQSTNNALSQNAQQDLKAMLIQGSGADIYVETEYLFSESASGNSVKVLMKACDVSTGSSLANKDAFSGTFYSNDVGRLAGSAVEKVADDFLNVIQNKFNDIVANGRSIILDFKVGDTYLEVKTPLTTINVKYGKDIKTLPPKPFSSTDRMVKHLKELAGSLKDHEKAVFLQVYQYRITERKERLRSTHYEEVSQTFKDAAEAGVEFWEIQMDFKPEGITLYSVTKSTDL